MATIKLWPQWLAFWTSLMGTFFHVNLRGGGGVKIFHFQLCLILTENCSLMDQPSPGFPSFPSSSSAWGFVPRNCLCQRGLDQNLFFAFARALSDERFMMVSYFFAFIFHWSRVRSDNDNWRNVSIYFTQWVRLLRGKIRELYRLWLILWWFISCICILSWFVPFPFWIAVRIVIKVLKLEVSYVWGSHDNT